MDKDERHRTKEAYERTHLWLERSIKEHKKLLKGRKDKDFPKLFGIAQGGLDKELRIKSLEFVQSQDVDGIAIGGLSVGESRSEMHETLDYLAPVYDPARPRYLMGVGHPIDMRYAIEHGIDMFDCVLPTRNGRHGSIWLPSDCTPLACSQAKPDSPPKVVANRGVSDSGAPSKYVKYSSVRSSSLPGASSTCSRCGRLFDEQVNLRNARFRNDEEPLPGDSLTAVEAYSKAYLHHLIKANESLAGTLLSIYNLRYLQAICEEFQK